MSIDSPSNPAASDQPKKNNCFLWGCGSVIILILISICCLGSLVFLPFMTDFDPLNLKERIGDIVNLGDYIDDPSQIPGLEDFFDDNFFDDEFDPFQEDGLPPADTSGPSDTDTSSSGPEAASIPLDNYAAADFSAYFKYPAGWDIEVEDSAVTFYGPDGYTYLFVGEEFVDVGTTAAEVAETVMESIREESEEGTFQLVSSSPWLTEKGEDAHLNFMEWTDTNGYYTWAYDLEIVLGEYNTFFFISGEDPDDIALYGDLIKIIADSFSRQ